MRTSRLYLIDILEAINSIEKFVAGLDFEAFKNDDLRCSAVIRKFEIMGEAAKNIPEDIRQKYDSVHWRGMAGMRDKLIHLYFGIKYEIVWNTVKDVIPELKTLIIKILEDE